MSTDGKVKGPASYFPSIEKTYGKPIEHWINIVCAQSGMAHMQIVAFLKETQGLGHGHANAIVAHTLADQKKA
jgi:Domain of unknown function (DUF4287)